MHRNIEKVDIDTPYHSPDDKRPRYRVIITVFTDDPIGMQSLIDERCKFESDFAFNAPPEAVAP